MIGEVDLRIESLLEEAMGKQAVDEVASGMPNYSHVRSAHMY